VVRLIIGLLASTLSGGALGEAARPPYKASDWPDTPAIVSGRASFYGKRFTGQKTASGKHFHHRDVSAASNLPKPLLGHERACTLAFSPPVRLPAAEGRLSDNGDDGQSVDGLAGGVGVR